MYTMKQTCRKTDMTYEALKFYCNEGLVPNVKRDAHNHRVFDDRDVEWIRSLTCLKSCGMSIREMKLYIGLCQQGEATIPERKRILSQKREELLRRMDEDIWVESKKGEGSAFTFTIHRNPPPEE